MHDTLVIDISNDIKWLSTSYPLLQTPDVELFVTNQPINQQTTHKQHYPALPAFRLGHVFEDVVNEFIKLSIDCDLLARNIQIYDSTRTLGELDCLYYHRVDQQAVHLEIAIKFYLYYPELLPQKTTHSKSSGLDRFIGPGGKDRLDKKWTRLINHQLKLSDNPSALETLRTKKLPLPDHSELLLTGYLFYPYEMNKNEIFNQNQALQHVIHPQHQYGWWLTAGNIELLEAHAYKEDWYFIILPKHYWIGGCAHYNNDEISRLCMNFKALKQTLTAGIDLPVHLVTMHNKGDRFTEVARGFVVSDNWPYSNS